MDKANDNKTKQRQEEEELPPDPVMTKFVEETIGATTSTDEGNIISSFQLLDIDNEEKLYDNLLLDEEPPHIASSFEEKERIRHHDLVPTKSSSCYYPEASNDGEGKNHHPHPYHAYLLDPKYLIDRQQREFDRRRVMAFDAKLHEKQ